MPQSGSLYQLSQVFSAYGYNPIAGVPISIDSTTKSIVITGSNNRIFYTRPVYDAISNLKVLFCLID